MSEDVGEVGEFLELSVEFFCEEVAEAVGVDKALLYAGKLCYGVQVTPKGGVGKAFLPVGFGAEHRSALYALLATVALQFCADFIGNVDQPGFSLALNKKIPVLRDSTVTWAASPSLTPVDAKRRIMQ